MKIILIVSVLILFAVPVKAQEYTSFEIESISKEAAWSAVQKTFKEQKLPVPALFKNSIKGESGFYKYWHTMKDNMAGISKPTLMAVGQTILTVVRNEN